MSNEEPETTTNIEVDAMNESVDAMNESIGQILSETGVKNALLIYPNPTDLKKLVVYTRGHFYDCSVMANQVTQEFRAKIAADLSE